MASEDALRAKPIFSQLPNWRRIFCRWFGHEWVTTRHFTAPQHRQWSCLRCYCCVYLDNPWRRP